MVIEIGQNLADTIEIGSISIIACIVLSRIIRELF